MFKLSCSFNAPVLPYCWVFLIATLEPWPACSSTLFKDKWVSNLAGGADGFIYVVAICELPLCVFPSVSLECKAQVRWSCCTVAARPPTKPMDLYLATILQFNTSFSWVSYPCWLTRAVAAAECYLYYVPFCVLTEHQWSQGGSKRSWIYLVKMTHGSHGELLGLFHIAWNACLIVFLRVDLLPTCWPSSLLLNR